MSEPVLIPAKRGRKARTVLALGPELKANFTIATDEGFLLYSGFGDLKQLGQYVAYEKAVMNALEKMKIKPVVIACDLNNQFLSSQLGRCLFQDKFSRPTLLPVQHHFAHAAAVMAEKGLLDKKVISVSCDGTGLGDDNRVWGFEFFVCDRNGYIRMAHPAYFPLPGGDAAVTEPWRTAIGLLYLAYGPDLVKREISWIKAKKRLVPVLIRMIEARVNTPWCSSAGRLFDAVSALTGVCLRAETEAAAAIQLQERAEQSSARGSYPFKLKEVDGRFLIQLAPLIKAVVMDVERGRPTEETAACFHNAFSRIIVDVCNHIRGRTGISSVLLSGGVFFNRIIREKVTRGLERGKFEVSVPSVGLLGDAGLSLGQAVIADVFRNSGKTGKSRR